MKPVKPVLWYQGLFLHPQHFQQSDAWAQSLISPFHEYGQPWGWGVCRMEMRSDALRDLSFDLAEGEFIFPDGTWASIPGNACIAPRTFKKDELEAGRPFTIFLGLRKWDPIRENVTIVRAAGDLSAADTRYVSPPDHEEVRDTHRGGPAAPVNLMEYVLRALVEKELESAPEFQVFPVAELVYDGNELKPTRSFVPPLVTIAASDSILQIVQNIREQVISHCHRLEEYKVPRDTQTAEMEAGYMLFLLALRSLNRYAPALCHLLEAPQPHPWTIYGLLRQMVGELSAFTDRINALGQLADGTELLPKYQHTRLLSCFSEAQMLITELLGSIVIGPERVVHLDRNGGYFTAQIPAEAFEGKHVYYLVLRTAESRGNVLEVMRNIAKVSSVEYMRTLIGRALPGIPLEFSLLPPPGLPNRPNSYHFRLELSSPQWTEIQKNQSICLYWDQAPKDTKAEFVIIRK